MKARVMFFLGVFFFFTPVWGINRKTEKMDGFLSLAQTKKLKTGSRLLRWFFFVSVGRNKSLGDARLSLGRNEGVTVCSFSGDLVSP